MNKQVTILGCGWLGLPLAKHVIKNNYKVKGSTTSEEKRKTLEIEQIDPYTIQLENDGVLGAIEDCLAGSDVLIINIPPGLHRNPDVNYANRIEHLVPHIIAASITKVLFVSSTSVYNDEESIPDITELSLLNPESKSGKQLLDAEKVLQSNYAFETTVLRFSGLFGADRHPAKSLSGRTGIKNPEAPVNLIHQTDCIQIIHSIIEQGIWGETFNAATPMHPSRKSYYTSVCKCLNLPTPKFEQISKHKGKLINSEKLIHILDYSFKVKL